MDIAIFNKFSAAEQAYAVSQLDPFHDTEYRLEGAPTDQSSKTFCITVNKEIVVSAADFGLPVTEGLKWDMHVALLPFLREATAYAAYSDDSGSLNSATSGTESPYTTLYPLTISAAATAGSTFIFGTGLIDFKGLDTDLMLYDTGGSSTVKNPRTARIISSAFEVVDESPEFYQQGAVTVYQRPSVVYPWRGHLSYKNPAGVASNTAAFVAKSFNGPPTNVSQATLIPGSKTWKAKEGCYVIARKNVDTVPFIRPSICGFGMMNPSDPTAPTLENCFIGREAVNLVATPSTSTYWNGVTDITPYNVGGAYFTGLSNQYGVYRIRLKLSIEILPDPQDTQSVASSTPTLPRNAAFETLLDAMVAKLPVGVPQTMNPAGEWWKMVRRAANGLAKVTVPVAATLGQPEVALIAKQVERLTQQKKSTKPKEKVVPKAKAKGSRKTNM